MLDKPFSCPTCQEELDYDPGDSHCEKCEWWQEECYREEKERYERLMWEREEYEKELWQEEQYYNRK